MATKGGDVLMGHQLPLFSKLVKKMAKSVYLSSQSPNFEELKMRALLMMGFRRSAMD